MEKEYKISWLKVIGVLALIIIVIAIICCVYPKKKNSTSNNAKFSSNITLMKKAGFDYFQGNNLPSEKGSKNRISLNDMIDNNLVEEVVDENGEACNKEDSYVQVTKTSNLEYEMKVFLSCKSKTDYILTTISTVKEVSEDKNETTNSSTTTTTNNSTSTTTKKPVSSGTSTTVVSNITYCNNGVCCADKNCGNNIYYTVTYDANGGYVAGSSTTSRTVKKGDTTLELYPSRDNYRFLGWYLNDVKYNFNTPITSKITLTAKWEKITSSVTNKYTVSFNTNGGSYISSQTIYEGGYATYKTPTKNCNEFVGWYYYDNYNNYRRFDFNTPIYKNTTLYAKWEDNGECNTIGTYIVRFNSNGGTSVSSQALYYGERAYEPNDPTRSGYTFDGWYLNGNLYNFNSRVYNNITLEAHWTRVNNNYGSTYSKYCKVKNKTYYSIGYITNQNRLDWTIRFDDIYATNVKVSGAYHVSSSYDYQAAYNHQYNKGMSMVNSGGSNSYAVYANSLTAFKNSALKDANFDESVSRAYESNGSWYVNVGASIYNTYNVTPYYASNINSYVYFVPYIINITYTDLNDCVTDYYSNRNLSKYNNYEIVDTYYR